MCIRDSDGDDDGQDAVAERLEPARSHGHSVSGASPASRQQAQRHDPLRHDGSAAACETPRMRMSDFWRLMDDEFGAAYARSLARDHVLGALGNRTPLEALEAGVKPREAWLALCVDMDVPVERRLGKELRDHTKRR